MLEILLLIALTKTIGAIVEGKGQKSGWYKFLTVMLWLGGEIVGLVIGVMVSDAESMGLAYVFGLMGAAMGAGLSYYIATQVKAKAAVDDRVFD